MPEKRIEEIDENLKPVEVRQADELRWLCGADKKFAKRGLHWYIENGGEYWRLPRRAKGIVREEVWEMAQWPAGAHLAFRSDTAKLAIRATNSDCSAIPVMAASGNGLALYMGSGSKTRPWAVAIPDQTSPHFERRLFEGLLPRMREFRLYLPQYKELKALEIGFSKGARILPPSPPAAKKPVVFYGTSITQGGCTSVPGGDFVSTIGRMLDIETINLGFAGNGRGEPEVATLIAEIDAGLFVLDYLANTTPALLRKTLPRFVGVLREKHPATPILLMSSLCFSQYAFSRDCVDDLEAKRDILLEFYSRQRKKGDRHLHFVDGYGLLPFGSDNAYTDGVHPGNGGFATIAERLAPVIEQYALRQTHHE